MRPKALLACLTAVLSLAMGVTSQTTTAQCLSGWEWSQNSLGQDPCTVATMLDAACRSDPLYSYPKITQDEWYVPPKKAHVGDMTCDCDTVMYSLVMTCSLCQGGSIYGWEAWELECNTVLITEYSGVIPQGTAIPHWAFYNVTSLDKQQFDVNNAQNIGRDPEALPTIQKTSSTGPYPTGSINGAGKSSSRHKNPAIIGGVVGGVGGLVIISVAVYFIYRWRRKVNQQKLQEQWDHPAGYDPRWMSPPHSSVIATYNQSLSTKPSVISNQPPQPYVPQPLPPNRVVTFVTPMPNSSSRSQPNPF